jgi:hypothetical protein
MTTAAASKPLLDLSTLDPEERAYILIDGVRYDLLAPADFGLLGLNRLDRMVDQVNAMMDRNKGGETLSDEETIELTLILKTVVGEVLRAPTDVLEKLTDIKRLAILQAFTPASPMAVTTKRPNRATRRTGASSSRASRASTARATG